MEVHVGGGRGVRPAGWVTVDPPTNTTAPRSAVVGVDRRSRYSFLSPTQSETSYLTTEPSH